MTVAAGGEAVTGAAVAPVQLGAIGEASAEVTEAGEGAAAPGAGAPTVTGVIGKASVTEKAVEVSVGREKGMIIIQGGGNGLLHRESGATLEIIC